MPRPHPASSQPSASRPAASRPVATRAGAARPHGRARRALLVLLAAGALLPGAGTVEAGPPHDARAALERGDAEGTRALLAGWVEQAAPGEEALEAARVASELADVDLLQALQAQLEGAPGTKEPGPGALALATAWLGLAEAHLSARDQSSAVPYLFADAEKKARSLLAADPEVAGPALCLVARTRHAQGDTAGALAVLGEHARLAARPEVAALEGWLLHEDVVARRLGPDGQATPEGRALLARAAERLAAALPPATGEAPEGGGGALPPREAARALLTRAYALHRTGQVEEAARCYAEAYRRRPADDKPLRGLKSLLGADPSAYRAALGALREERPADLRLAQALAAHLLEAGDAAGAAAVARGTADAAPTVPEAHVLESDVLRAGGRFDEAFAAGEAAHRLAPTRRLGADAMERAAAARMAGDVEHAVALYERLLRLLPDDPYVRNNLGFLLREAVTPFTDLDPVSGLQRLKADAPHRARLWLARSVAAYREAVERLPALPDAAGRGAGAPPPAEAWNAAGVVNDLALMLHYFVDVQDLPQAEALYLRALALTHGAFKDTYAPNLQRLYRLLPDRAYAWYRAAVVARDAILREEGTADDGSPLLVPDEAKRAAAAQDAERLRAWLVRTLQEEAAADGSPLDPPAPGAAPK